MVRQTRQQLLEEKEELERSLRSLRQRLVLLEQERSQLAREREQLAERTRVLDRVRRELAGLNERLELLARLTKEINELNPEAIFEVCMTKVPYLLRATSASLYLYDPERERLLLKKHTHDRGIAPVIDLQAQPRSLMARVLRDGRVQVFQDLDARPPAGRGVDSTEAERPHRDRYRSSSCIVAPLRAGDDVLGVLNLADRVDGRPFTTDEDLPLASQVAEVLAVALRNCQLFQLVQQQARTDSLTQLANRQSYFEALEREVERAARYGGALTAAVLDIDRFKQINDAVGHLAGDQVLQELAQILAATVRVSDLCARYGGDEFALLLPESDLAAARAVAERIRTQVAEHRFHHQGRAFEIRVSIGLAQFEGEGERPADLLRRADAAMYRAKRAGGDRVEG
ncbi:MAG: sensor domain-containing diguanylate cyclase [Planctomycetota bacterium]|nr:MAG: sensor domain-containing diguanylate cyclase [Planctomycetota bacterium]